MNKIILKEMNHNYFANTIFIGEEGNKKSLVLVVTSSILGVTLYTDTTYYYRVNNNRVSINAERIDIYKTIRKYLNKENMVTYFIDVYNAEDKNIQERIKESNYNRMINVASSNYNEWKNLKEKYEKEILFPEILKNIYPTFSCAIVPIDEMDILELGISGLSTLC